MTVERDRELLAEEMERDGRAPALAGLVRSGEHFAILTETALRAMARARREAFEEATRTLQEVEGLRKALETISVGDEPRPVGAMWRNDAKPSKNDKCIHGRWMYEDCGACVADFARSLLDTRGEG